MKENVGPCWFLVLHSMFFKYKVIQSFNILNGVTSCNSFENALTLSGKQESNHNY